MKLLLGHSLRRPLVAASAAALAVALSVGCDKKSEESPAPTVAVMPSSAAVVDASATATTNDSTASAPLAILDGGGRGTVSVIQGAGPTTAPTSVVASPPAEVLTSGLPPAPAASLPGASSIGTAASASDGGQPLSVSPGSPR